MTRKLRPFDEEAERRFYRVMGYTFDELVERAAREEALAKTYRDLAAAELAMREHETSRGRKWSATYHARRSSERAARGEARARILREIAEQTPTCELPTADLGPSIRPGHTARSTHVGFVNGCPDCGQA